MSNGKATRGRMTAAERREQLIETARGLFAERGFDGTAVEEIAARAGVSKPVVYEHFGGKEGVYAVVVDREVRTLLTALEAALVADHPRQMLEQAAVALLGYVETRSDGFRILVRDRAPGSASGQFATIMNDVVTRVEHILAHQLEERGFDAAQAPMYAQMLVGMVGHTGQWWLDVRRPSRDEVAAHVVNLAWHGLAHLERRPTLRTVPAGHEPG
jgi:AcrR family transcriptional regulator